MNLRGWILLVLGGLGVAYAAYYGLVLIPRMRQINDLMNVAFNSTGHYIFAGVVLLIASSLVWAGWKKLRNKGL